MNVGVGGKRSSGVREEERAIIVVGVIFVVFDAEVDARAPLQGCKESRGNVGADPVGHSVQFVARHEPTVVVAVAVAVAVAVVGGVNFVHLC